MVRPPNITFFAKRLHWVLLWRRHEIYCIEGGLVR